MGEADRFLALVTSRGAGKNGGDSPMAELKDQIQAEKTREKLRMLKDQSAAAQGRPNVNQHARQLTLCSMALLQEK